MARFAAVASLLMALALVTACTAPPSTPAQKSSAVQLASTPKTAILRSQIVSASTTPEDVVRHYLDASNRGDGAVMNALLGRGGSKLNGDMPSAAPSIGDIEIHPAVGKDPSTAVEVTAEVKALDANNYFGLEPGPAEIRFVLLKDDDGLVVRVRHQGGAAVALSNKRINLARIWLSYSGCVRRAGYAQTR